MSAFTTAQAQALRQLAELWRDTRFCLIGASALACQIELPRQTDDLDMSVSVSLDERAAGIPRLEGWEKTLGNEHEWRSPNGVKVDVLPAGPSLLAAGEITWPGTSARMSLTGMRAVDDFVARVRDERHPLATQGRMARLGPSSWKQDPDELLARIEAFMAGFGSGKKA